MPPMDMVDIGGGFSTIAHNPENNFDKVGPLIDQFVREKKKGWLKNVRIFEEPGRIISQESLHIVTRVILAR